MQQQRTFSRSFSGLVLILSILAQGCKQPGPPAHHHGPAVAEAPVPLTAGTTITVNGGGYHPANVSAPPNTDITLTFLRTTDECCGQQLKIPSDGRTIDLPLNQRVAVNLHTPASGQLAFTCGMDMYRGSIVVR